MNGQPSSQQRVSRHTDSRQQTAAAPRGSFFQTNTNQTSFSPQPARTGRHSSHLRRPQSSDTLDRLSISSSVDTLSLTCRDPLSPRRKTRPTLASCALWSSILTTRSALTASETIRDGLLGTLAASSVSDALVSTVPWVPTSAKVSVAQVYLLTRNV